MRTALARGQGSQVCKFFLFLNNVNKALALVSYPMRCQLTAHTLGCATTVQQRELPRVRSSWRLSVRPCTLSEPHRDSFHARCTCSNEPHLHGQVSNSGGGLFLEAKSSARAASSILS